MDISTAKFVRVGMLGVRVCMVQAALGTNTPFFPPSPPFFGWTPSRKNPHCLSIKEQKRGWWKAINTSGADTMVSY